jgi:hypothetical protein
MPGVVHDLVDRAVLDDLAGVHDGDVVAVLRDDAQVVSDQQQRTARLPHQVLEQVEDLRLDRDVEGRGRLVGDDHVRLTGQHHRDHHALTHATGQLVHVRPQHPLRAGDAHALEQLECAVARLATTQAQVAPHSLGHLLLDRQHGVQCRHRLLEDHRQVAPVDPVALRGRHGDQVDPVELCPARNPTARRVDAHQRDCGHALPAAGLTHEPPDLAALESERDPTDRLEQPAAHGQLDRQVLHAKRR